jgi:hypothetical protein
MHILMSLLLENMGGKRGIVQGTQNNLSAQYSSH